jgi:biopolymer transport protein ExbB
VHEWSAASALRRTGLLRPGGRSRSRAGTRGKPRRAVRVRGAAGAASRSPDRRDVDGIKERIAARFERIEAAVGRKMLRGTGILATIGATAPFVGLFGTVWGIMNSFIGISKLHTTNLAVVAPGIAEALLTTALSGSPPRSRRW